MQDNDVNRLQRIVIQCTSRNLFGCCLSTLRKARAGGVAGEALALPPL